MGCCTLPDASACLQPGASKKEHVSSLEQVLKEVRSAGRGGCWAGQLSPALPPLADSPFFLQTSREMVARSAATLITHPFHGKYPRTAASSCCSSPRTARVLGAVVSPPPCSVPLSPADPASPGSARSDHPAMHGAVHRQGDQVQVQGVGTAVGCCVPAWRDLSPLPPRPSGTLSAFATIYREEGILGFFA